MSEHRDKKKCHVEPMRVEVEPSELESARAILLAVEGMGCPNCANRVRNALLRTPGVLAVEMDLTGGRATVAIRQEMTDVTPLLQAVAASGAGTHHVYRAALLQPRTLQPSS